MFVDPSGKRRLPSRKQIREMLQREREREAQEKEKHYSRNEQNTDIPQTKKEAEAAGWKGDIPANCHQFTAKDGEKNVKYVSPDGKKEVIYDSKGNLVTAPEDEGTYNYASPDTDPIGHFF